MTALFLAVEGPNGVGKTTIARALAERLGERTQRAVHLTGEPTRSPLGHLIRNSESVLQGRTLALALAADRDHHIETVILPELNAGRHVICDRYVSSSLVLHRIDGMDLDEIWSYNRYTLPAIVIYLEDTPEVISARLQARPTLTRLQAISAPAKELRFYRDAARFLRRQDWRQHTVACQGRTALDITDDILRTLDL